MNKITTTACAMLMLAVPVQAADVVLVRDTDSDNIRTPVIVIGVDNAFNRAQVNDVIAHFNSYYLPTAEANDCFAAADPVVYFRIDKYASPGLPEWQDTGFAFPAHSWADKFDMAHGGYIHVRTQDWQRESQFFEGDIPWSYPGPADNNVQDRYNEAKRTGMAMHDISGASMPHDPRRQFPCMTSHDAGENRGGGTRCQYDTMPMSYMHIPGHSGGGWFSNWGRDADPNCTDPPGFPESCGLQGLLYCDGGMHYWDKLGFAGDDPEVFLWAFLAAFSNQTNVGENHTFTVDLQDPDAMLLGFNTRGIEPPESLREAYDETDFNHDGVTDTSDLGYMLTMFGNVNDPAADLNNDGVVDTADLSIVLEEVNK